VLAQGALGALMAGSGSAVFGVFADHKGAQEAAARMSKNGVWARVVRTIGSGASFAR
jgi:4-diphosphocytidyl-2C-methyl-D-erythritol kinase